MCSLACVTDNCNLMVLYLKNGETTSGERYTHTSHTLAKLYLSNIGSSHIEKVKYDRFGFVRHLNMNSLRSPQMTEDRVW